MDMDTRWWAIQTFGGMVLFVAGIWLAVHTARDVLELNNSMDYRRQVSILTIERDNLQLQLDQIRLNLRKRGSNGDCLCNPPVRAR